MKARKAPAKRKRSTAKPKRKPAKRKVAPKATIRRRPAARLPTHTKQRERGGRKITTGRRSAGASEARVRFSGGETKLYEAQAARAGKSTAAWLRDLARRETAKNAPAPEAPKPIEWATPFTRFARETLGLTLTRGQSVLAKVIFDGRDPCELEGGERVIARELFENVDRFTPSQRAGLTVLRLGRGSGKTMLCAAFGVFRMVTADLSTCGPGDTPAIAIVSPRGRTSQIAVGYGREFSTRPLLRDLVDSSRADGFALRRPDGRLIEFTVIPKSRGGMALRGFSLPMVVVDESEFVPSGGRDALVSDDDLISAAMPRMTPDGLMLLVSTPWPAPSATATAFETNFGHPVTGIAAKGSTLLLRDYDPQVSKRIELETQRSPTNALREYSCELTDGAGGSFFEPSSITRAISPSPIVSTRSEATAGIDPAFVNDSSALVVVERHGELVVVVHSELRTPEPHRPLIPSEVIGAFAASAMRYGCSSWATDSHRVATVRQHAESAGIETVVLNTEESMVALREVLREGRLRIPNDPRLIAQLRSVMFRPRTGGGLTILSPRSREGGHGDLVSALAMAVFAEPTVVYERPTIISMSSR